MDHKLFKITNLCWRGDIKNIYLIRATEPPPQDTSDAFANVYCPGDTPGVERVIWTIFKAPNGTPATEYGYAKSFKEASNLIKEKLTKDQYQIDIY